MRLKDLLPQLENFLSLKEWKTNFVNIFRGSPDEATNPSKTLELYGLVVIIIRITLDFIFLENLGAT